MKTLLVIAMFTWGPDFPDVRPSGTVFTQNMKTEAACLAAVADENKNAVGTYAGPIGNLPGWFRVDATFCHDPKAPWPMLGIAQ